MNEDQHDDENYKEQNNYTPVQPPNSFRVILVLNTSGQRLDSVLLTSLREQKQSLDLKNISRSVYKELFSTGKILIKGQRAKPSSTLAKGQTFVDILGYK
jgi:23S rRNA-/tRNA-specific pseudouridylate synthase